MMTKKLINITRIGVQKPAELVVPILISTSFSTTVEPGKI